MKSNKNSTRRCLNRYFEIVSSIQDGIVAYKWQTLFMIIDVICNSIIHGYFFLTDKKMVYKINSLSSIISDFGLADEFISELYTALRNNSTLLSGLQKKLELVIRMHTSLGFSAGGFIELRNGLLTSMLSAVVTYLVMVVQLQGGLPAN
ncbi:hypothetical protein GE061_007664 [Apolygus lucorum]|uniref:Gustatory receptor n=1 Tax=Apolygus lucorum TaxID=248454 RepID=A0A8S9WP48_APOLU|nr:hypothetical protein GE061_007664 [Apolygus lucorum]